MLEKDFVPYEPSLSLKELGFDEPCFKMSEHKKVCDEQSKPQGCQLHNLHCGYPDCTIDKSITPVPLPTFSQAFRWFRDKYQIDSWIYPNLNGLYSVSIVRRGVGLGNVSQYQTYPEAELGCLIKLIEIVKNK
jgi:hypothetical protein